MLETIPELFSMFCFTELVWMTFPLNFSVVNAYRLAAFAGSSDAGELQDRPLDGSEDQSQQQPLRGQDKADLDRGTSSPSETFVSKLNSGIAAFFLFRCIAECAISLRTICYYS